MFKQNNKIKDLLKGRKRSIAVKMTIAFVVFTLLMDVVQLINTAISRGRALKGYFTEQVSGKLQTVDLVNKTRLNELDVFVASLPAVYPHIDSSLVSGDYSYVTNLLRDNVKARHLQGFLLMDSKCNLISTSYATYTQPQLEQMKEFMRYLVTTPEKKYAGYADVMGTGIGIVSAHIWQAEGSDPVMVLLCLATVENDGYLMEMAQLLQTDLSVYRDNLISATSYDCHDVDIHGLPIPQDWVADSLRILRKCYTLSEVAGAEEVYSAYEPLFDHSGNLLGFLHVWLGTDVQADVSRKMRTSVIIASILFSATFIFLFWFFMKRTLINPLLSLRDDAQRIASGDLSQPVREHHTHDEIEQLSISMATMQESLRRSLAMLAQTGATVQRSSAHIGKASQQLADVTNRQASNLEEISASLEEMAHNINATSDNAAETDRLMAQANTQVASIADKATESMNATRKIAGSLRSINSLVSQTNVLSLNAAVEAARAGSLGRGFSVVAREVGRLADQTKQTSGAMTQTSEASIAGAENINRLIDELVPQMLKVSDSIKHITNSSHDQGAGIEQINEAASSLNAITQDMATGSEQLAASAQELASMAVRMKNLLDTFKV